MASGITILLYRDVRSAFQSTIARISPPFQEIKLQSENVASPFRTDLRQSLINGDVECFHPAITETLRLLTDYLMTSGCARRVQTPLYEDGIIGFPTFNGSFRIRIK